MQQITNEMIEQLNKALPHIPSDEFIELYNKYVGYIEAYTTQKFYFTFGIEGKQAFKGGWIVIEAPNETIARTIFKALYPHPEDTTIANFAAVYDENSWKDTCMYKNNHNYNASCHASFKLIKTNNI